MNRNWSEDSNNNNGSSYILHPFDEVVMPLDMQLRNAQREKKFKETVLIGQSAQLAELKKILSSIDASETSIDEENPVLPEKHSPVTPTEDKSIEPSKTSSPIYKFCNGDPEYEKIKDRLRKSSVKEIIKDLQEASDKNVDISNLKDDKRLLRVACHMVLNEKGIAPSFRDAKSGLTNKKTKPFEEIEESNDRQIIDLHWIFLHHLYDVNPTEWLENIFTSSEFSFDEAEKFVSMPRKTNLKVKRLGIPKDIEKLLLSLRNQDTLTFQKKKREQIENLKMAFINKSRHPSSRLEEQNLDVNLAAFRCLLFAEQSVTLAINYWRFIPADITGQVTQQLKPWMKTRLKLLKELLDEEITTKRRVASED